MYSKILDEYQAGFSIGDIDEVTALRIITYCNYISQVDVKDPFDILCGVHCNVHMSVDEDAKKLKGKYTVYVWSRKFIESIASKNADELHEKMEALRRHLLSEIIIEH